MNVAPTTRLAVTLGPELFRFHNYSHWVDKSRGWFRTSRQAHDIPREAFLCVDAAGRVCAWGAHFRRAAEEGTYPVVVYCVEQLPTDESSRQSKREIGERLDSSTSRVGTRTPRSGGCTTSARANLR